MDAKILDLGSGVGNVIRSWKEKGYKCVRGIEISGCAVRASGEDCIVEGSVQNMPFEDKEFDLVCSFALMEHLAESIEEECVREMYRVGKIQAHYLCLDKGQDPSHINMKESADWMGRFKELSPEKYVVYCSTSPFVADAPLLIAIPAELMPHQSRAAVLPLAKEETVSG